MPQHPAAIEKAQAQVAIALATRGVPARRAAEIAQSYSYHSSDTPDGPVLLICNIDGDHRRLFAHDFGATLADRVAAGVVAADAAPPADGETQPDGSDAPAAPAMPTRSKPQPPTLRSSVAGYV